MAMVSEPISALEPVKQQQASSFSPTVILKYCVQLVLNFQLARSRKALIGERLKSKGIPSFTDVQLQTLLAIADTFIPTLTEEETATLQKNLTKMVTPQPPKDAVLALAAEKPSNIPEFVDNFVTTIPQNTPAQKLKQFKVFLWLLNFRMVSVLLTGGFALFHELPRERREQVLLRWKNSKFDMVRRTFDSCMTLMSNTYLRTSKVAQEAMQFPGVAAAKEVPLGVGYDFKFEATLDGLPEFDAIIIGSGSGGGVTAKILSEAGMRVLVIEKGEHIPGQVTMEPNEVMNRRYEKKGIQGSVDGSIFVLSTSTFGGGSTINWAASLQLPAAMRKEWSEEHGLPMFTSRQFQESLDSVWTTMGVTVPGVHNYANNALMEGAHNLGLAHAAVPQNTGGSPTHACNHLCSTGCMSGQKQGGINCWLISAAENSAHFMTSTYCTRIAFDVAGATTGVHIRLPNSKTESFIRSPRVIVSSGAINTPTLLLRSGLQNPHIGRNLHLHPTTVIHTLFPTTAVAPWRGNILTSVITSQPRLHLETMCMTPMLCSAFLPWRSGAQYKQLLTAYNSTPAYISLVRDLDSGRVTLDPFGEPRIAYTTSARDAATAYLGVETLADVLLSAGAERIITNIRGLADLHKGQDVEQWKRALRSRQSKDTSFGSAHQMGTARMGRSRKEGVVDAGGKVWERSGLWVADGSLLPGASGVNPMVTIMAVSKIVADGVVAEWKKSDEGKGKKRTD